MNPRARYDEIADDLAARDPSIELSQMMGMPCIKSGGKMVIGYSSVGEMVFKLPDEAEHDKAMAMDGAKLFDPSGRGKPFKEWVQVPFAHASEWAGLADTAIRLRAG
ncbi:MAG: hypothetical protein AABM30_01185 [Actinomycetota bacterium]